jgi:hypothetical protein
MGILTKMKECAGFDGVPHKAYIYKNIEGKKYCKSCAFKLQPPKSISKMSDKGKFKMTLKKELFEQDKKFYSEVWAERFFAENKNIPGTYVMLKAPRCENPDCQKRLGDEPNLLYFHHILEKRNYPEYRHLAENIAILCPECHNLYESYPDKVPYLVDRRKYLIALFLKTIENDQSKQERRDEEPGGNLSEGITEPGN